ncbi:hypothetical protein LHYA1_G001680 [Lachnellula hyalina]|uniref:Uncharacterized protein n=1 Tax=Lachnellula hyalina TaxID=1316788 RepID=A0A8H8R5M0_9HELO|nr:uncharacterized protein LHYA1_G001680 [Lachnellula hyalina]TVY28893.1 hypothetical protein LHYA1_G001680 [Lachnellula hyalina]
MGWFDGGSEIGGSRHHHDKHNSHHNSSSRHQSSGSIFGSGDHKHNSSRSSFFGGDPKRNSSRSSFFGFGGSGGGHRSSSYYKRSPRGGFVKRVYSRLRRLLRDLLYYMKRNPIKVFVLVIMPLVTGGALSGLLGRFGIRLPGGLDKMFGGGAGIGRGREGGMQFERSSYRSEGPLGGMGGIGSAMGGLGGLGGAMSLAKMFM